MPFIKPWGTRIVLRGRHSRPPCGAGRVEVIMPLAKCSQHGKTHHFAWTAQPAAMRSRARCGYYAFGKMFSTRQNASFCVGGAAGRHAEQGTLRVLCLWQNILNAAKRIVLRGRHSRPPCGAGHVEVIITRPSPFFYCLLPDVSPSFASKTQNRSFVCFERAAFLFICVSI